MFGGVSDNTFSENFLETIIRISVVIFIFIEIPSSRHILLNTFRRMRLKYENHFWEASYFRHSNRYVAAWKYKSFIARLFDGNTLKMKAASRIYFPNQKWTLVSCTRFLRAQSGSQVNLRAPEIGCNETKSDQACN